MDEPVLQEKHLESTEQKPYAGRGSDRKSFDVRWKLFGEFKGSSSVAGQPHTYVNGVIYQPPASFAFFCRGCKQIWATVEVEVDAAHWRVETRACPKHGIGYMLYCELPEEHIWLTFEYSTLENPPIEIALRELELIGENLDLARYPGGYAQQIKMGV